MAGLSMFVSFIFSKSIFLYGSGTEHQRDQTGICFWGGKVIFPDFFPGVKCFFPVENSHFGRLKTNFLCFQKSERQKKKKNPPLFIAIFLLFFSIFIPFPLPHFSRYVSKNFPVRSLWGALCPPAPPPPPPVTPLSISSRDRRLEAPKSEGYPVEAPMK